jgi:hypothetical protein
MRTFRADARETCSDTRSRTWPESTGANILTPPRLLQAQRLLSAWGSCAELLSIGQDDRYAVSPAAYLNAPRLLLYFRAGWNRSPKVGNPAPPT